MKRISSGSPFEELASYSRAVIDDFYIYVSGTVGIDPVTKAMPKDITEQMNNIFSTVEQTLAEVQAGLADVTRCRVYVVDEADLPAVIKVLGDKFRDHRPANTTLLCRIPAPGAKVEIEITARLPKGSSV